MEKIEQLHPINVLIGLALLVTAGAIFKTRQRVADSLHGWYNNTRDPSWRPAWLPWAFRPSRRQSLVAVYMLMTAVAAIAAAAILTGLAVF